MGDPVVEYAKLHDYVAEILRSNPGSTCYVKCDRKSEPGKQVFRKFYVCFHALKQGFKQGCRRVIGLDGCFLKGPCQGQLLAAVSKDSNNQMFPVAWAVVEIENKNTWKWFIEQIREDLELGDGTNVVIITDMQKVRVLHAIWN